MQGFGRTDDFKNRMFGERGRTMVCSLLVSGATLLSGCREATGDSSAAKDAPAPVPAPTVVAPGAAPATKAVAPAAAVTPTPAVPPVPAVPEIPYIIAGKDEPPHWYDKLQVVLHEKPAQDQDLKAQLNEHKAEVDKATAVLLEDVRKAAEAKGISGDKWSLVSVTCTKKNADFIVNAHVGLSKLYAKRPSITFNGMQLELCVGKLARDSGLQVAQSARGYNPRVNYTKTDVSPYDALESILAEHNFRRKYTGVSESTNVRIQDFSTETEFIDTAVQAILAKVRVLSTGRPGVVVTPRGSPIAKTPPAAVPAPKPPASVPAPPASASETPKADKAPASVPAPAAEAPKADKASEIPETKPGK